jgi:hypothetical protein
MNQNMVQGHRFERFLLGMGMSVMLLVIERRVIKMQRAGETGGGRDARRR